MAFSPGDLELIRMTAADLKFLGEAAHPTATDDELRRLSVTLRSLLVEGHIHKTWKLLGQPKSPTIFAPKLRTDLVAPDCFASAGGAELPGGVISQASVSNRFMSIDELVAMAKTVSLGDTSFPFPLSDYLASCSIFTKGRRVTRQQVVLYVAHKKGGAHWDTSRSDKKAEISYKSLDDLGDVRIGGSYDAAGGVIQKSKHPVSFEILSIAQLVFRSPDIQHLIAEAEKFKARSGKANGTADPRQVHAKASRPSPCWTNVARL